MHAAVKKVISRKTRLKFMFSMQTLSMFSIKIRGFLILWYITLAENVEFFPTNQLIPYSLQFYVYITMVADLSCST